MRIVNLLPWKERIFRRNRAIFYAIFLMIIVMQGLIFLYFYRVILDKNRKLLLSTAHAEEVIGAVPSHMIVAREEALKKMRILSELEYKKTIRDDDVINLFAVIANTLPNNMILTVLSWQNGKINLAGEGDQLASIVDYQHGLQKIFYNKKVQLVEVQKTNASSMRALQFRLEIL